MKKLKTFLYYGFCSLLCWIILIQLLLCCSLYLRNFSDLPYDDYDVQVLDKLVHTRYELMHNSLPKLTDKEWKQKVNAAMNTSFYIEIRLNSIFGITDCGGMTLAPFNTILIQNDLHEEYYGYVLLHELIHLRKLIGNERETTWKAFKLAWNSKCPYMQVIATLAIWDSITTIYDQYCITGRIINYIGG